VIRLALPGFRQTCRFFGSFAMRSARNDETPELEHRLP
jgi:hypothetical protein